MQLMVLHSLPSGFGEMLYYIRRSHMYGREGKLNIVIFMDIHTYNTQFMVSYSQAGRFKEMLYHRKSHMYGRKGNFKDVILWTFTHLKHNLWFYRHIHVIIGFTLTS